MPKDINIHLKTTGAEQTKQRLEDITQGVKEIGDKTAEMGHKASTASGMFSSLFARFAGPLGIIAAIAAVAKITQKVAEFFDTIKQRSDEAVRQLEQIRSGFGDIFEALNAFDEKSRQVATKETYQLLQKAGTPEAIGLPIVNAYIRQFKGLVDTGQLTQQQYQQGLETMLSYGVRHGQAATPDLIQLMGGWRMNQPDQQAAFTRQIAAASQAVGLTDEELIQSLSRGMPTIKAMAWTPAQALEAVATMAAGEPSPRMRAGIPAAGLQAIMAPQAEKLAYAEVAAAQQAKSAADKAKAEAARTKTYAAKKAAAQAEVDADAKQLVADQAIAAAETLAEDPLAFLRTVEEKRAAMTRDRFNRLLRDIYGPEGGLAIGKLITERRKGLADTIRRAATEQGAAADRAEQDQYKTTNEFRGAITKAQAKQIQLDITEQEQYMEDVREIGKAKYDLFKRREGEAIPTRLRDVFIGTLPAMQAEYGAYRIWEESLSEEEKKKIATESAYHLGYGDSIGHMQTMSPWEKWKTLTAREKLEAVTHRRPITSPISPSISGEGIPPIPGETPPTPESPPTSQHFDNRIINYQIFNPVSGMNKQDLGIEPPYLA